MISVFYHILPCALAGVDIRRDTHGDPSFDGLDLVTVVHHVYCATSSHCQGYCLPVQLAVHLYLPPVVLEPMAPDVCHIFRYVIPYQIFSLIF